eukprot:CAMPEP_0118723606 /NCGR_PEP_ID=MMETSP0800-20121206/32097_1 /TAXON_ID=210618 ORGANISM="Striatella unipunctata, Strain CCMP2910" /NCGR_SAMPLE_ID=MMETSP0800 /ASSEMBLY_ACC=CAM_ASM_000638 /LENGTH=516 /DNA_ID=CAMNT_0006632051 /DNA_START=198 /DNA_END=1748 /DNA_ORIENTATION=+
MEAAALMKNDRIRVRRNRVDERASETERRRLQNENDRDFFDQLRMELNGGYYCDLTIDCRGKVTDEHGLQQKYLTTSVRAHSAILSKRCKWLGRLIACARYQQKQQQEMKAMQKNENIEMQKDADVTMKDDSCKEKSSESGDNSKLKKGEGETSASRIASGMSIGDDEDDDGITVIPVPIQRSEESDTQVVDSQEGAAEIEIDDDESSGIVKAHAEESAVTEGRSSSPLFSSESSSSALLKITVNHPPEAVKLLLEYCYTNRVIPLGKDAFYGAFRTKSDGPLSWDGAAVPFSSNSHSGRGWPNAGRPSVAFSVALAGIALAAEASMPRFSLMCEIAASYLVSPQTIIDALSLCTNHLRETGSSLPMLRKAAVNGILENGPRGVTELCNASSFQRQLADRREAVVPSLLVGATEAILQPKAKNIRKRDFNAQTRSFFEKLDREDAYSREGERRKRRLERLKEGKDPSFPLDGSADDDALETFANLLASETNKNLKRMSNHFGFDMRGKRQSKRRLM